MTLPTPIWIVLGTLALTACAAAPDRYVIPTPQIADQQRIAFRSVEIRKISLPAYAASDEIAQQGADGRVISDGGLLWADTPERAVALELSRHLSRLTGARVASEPWPFETFADARLELRFESLIAGEDGQFRTNGQYFVAVENGRERSGLFSLAVPFDPSGGPQAIAAARGQIILDLARYVAVNGLR
ncbi:ABC-type transport auxiliary lipoprotein family protein [uncultured Roseobacter sp.]|uniref:PqiC family protein n=1 Tax=uncultured Roseobacter sp. TaxID=114847 RepID=UPI0026234950|nr:ABC-type transport auxiliary lipoprotein family protein [uncultured Roseobacter sp.]